jgi:predicted porin
MQRVEGDRMKRALLATTGLIGAGLGSLAPLDQAWAADGIQLSVGGFFREAYMAVIDDDDAGEDGFNEPGFDRNTDGFFNDAEIHFVGRTTLDNGLEVGARVELEGESEGLEGGDQIDEAWVWFSGGWGELRIGSDDDALANSCIMPPGGTANFSAFSPNQWGANSVNSNTACTGADALSDAQKIIYITPVLYGFQLTASYTPEESAETHTQGAGPHLGMTFKNGDFSPDYNVSAYLTYTYEGDDWGLTWGGGMALGRGTNTLEGGGVTFDTNDQDFYQTGLSLRLGNFAIGGAFEYFNDVTNVTIKSGNAKVNVEQNGWVAGIGAAYTLDAWTLGAQYSYRQDKQNNEFFAPPIMAETVQQRAVLTANYALGSGINLDAELGYTWVDIDVSDDVPDFVLTQDNYDAFEIGIGTAITF